MLRFQNFLERKNGRNAAKLPIEIISIGDIFYEPLAEAVKLVNSLQDEFVYDFREDELRMHTFNKLYAPDYLDLIENRKILYKTESSFLIVIVNSVLDGKLLTNLFATHRAEKRIAVVTTNNVPDIIIPSQCMTSYFIYYLARYTLGFLYPNHKNHDDTRSCVFDRKIYKLDLLKSMKARSICDECRRKLLLEDMKISATQFQALDRMFALSGKLLSEGT